MAKVDDRAVIEELALEDERLTVEKKRGRHETVALNHIHKQRDGVVEKIRMLKGELDKLDAAILALE